MPIFEYTCEDCGTAFEKLVRSAANGAASNGVACPSCGEHHVKREFSTFSARANGPGPQSAPAEMQGCPSGMCGNPGMCGRNN
ncbi:MAG: zinc ribbon domain-containing protein [Acidobacteriota bacterium]